MSFNHSDYDPDGMQTGRFTGGLLGLARFTRIDSGWTLQVFQPAIGAYGSFSAAPTPHPLLIGDHQYAYMIIHVNGGPGGPFRQDNYLIAEVADSFKQVLFAYNCGREQGGDSICKWTCSYRVLPGEKRLFKDIEFVRKGRYYAADKDGLPEELKGKVKGEEQGDFTITQVFSYSNKNGYLERGPARVLIKRQKA